MNARMLVIPLLACPGIAFAISAGALGLGDEMIGLGVVTAIALPIAGFLLLSHLAGGKVRVCAVESLYAVIDSLPPGTKTFELYVPNNLTIKGEPIWQNLAMALILDRILGKQLYPNGFVEMQNGRLYKYTSDPNSQKGPS